MQMTKVFSPDAIPAGGHYSQAISAGGMIYISGQLGISKFDDPTDSVHIQVHRVLNSLKEILAVRGADIASVAKVTIYVTDIKLWPEIDAIYSDFFANHKPARAIVPVPELHYGAKIELEAIAIDTQ
ncbi:MAG: hypothetical protein JKY25_01495 [Robiginitomaculum sp.]|nr:hypothetical protein [Robiginitomaculum sp.]